MGSILHPSRLVTRPRRAWFLAPALAAVLACGPAAAAPAATPPAPTGRQLTIAPEAAMKPWTGDLDGMIERRTIRVLVAYSKTFYFMNKGVQRGATYDLVRGFEDDLNKKLAKDKKLRNKHFKVRVLFIPVGRDELLPALVAGKGDIAASNLTVTAQRDKQVDFSVPLLRNVSEVVVSGPASPAVASLGDLSGKEIFVRKSSSYYESLVALNHRLTAERKPAVVIKEAPPALEDEDLLEMLNAGLLPLVIVDKHKADFWKQVFPKITVHDTLVVRSGADVGWAMREKSPQLKAAVDDYVSRTALGTAAGNMILARYLKNADYVKDAASEAERRKFLALVDSFKKYGTQYNVDWVLMGAQGYQESQLNQAARSRVGAIGVMQLMPATGKELNVGDIRKVEANIHGGVKYMRWMIDRYYAKEPMTDLDKALFAFASYNAGPRRVAQLRNEAARRGLDPNVWFHNVEYVATEKVGAETATYVSNIYKYYIAYRLILDERAKREQAAAQMKTPDR